jgi:pimeloyl-ACP methyl ester carboxylesterase
MLNTTTEIHGGKQVRLVKAGTGNTVIMLHGYPENLQVFEKVVPELAKNHEVIAFDWPGMGYSEEWKGGATPLIMAKRLLTLIDEWHIDSAHLIAQDMGGQAALVFAALYPERIRSLVIMNSLVIADSETSWEIKWLRKFGINKLLLKYGGWLVFKRALFTFLPHGYTLNPDLCKNMWQAFSKPSVRQFIVRMCAGYEAQLKKLPEYYRQIKCPVYILWGEDDKHFPPVQAQQLQQYIPHAKLEVLKAASHWMVLTKSEEIIKKIEDFYTGL